jgi:hypothetical protein
VGLGDDRTLLVRNGKMAKSEDKRAREISGLGVACACYSLLMLGTRIQSWGFLKVPICRGWRLVTKQSQTADEYGILARNLFDLAI